MSAAPDRSAFMDDAPIDSHDRWIREYLAPRYPELVAAYMDARSIHQRGKASGSLDPEEAERLLSHARSARTPLGENAAGMLGDLFASIPSLETAIRILANGKRVHERVNALVALSDGPVTALHVDLLAQLLHDKSRRVRSLASDKIVIHRITGLASVLEAAAHRETNVALAGGLKTDLDLLVHGFHVRDGGDHIWVTCQTARGGRVGKRFMHEEYRSAGPAWVNEVLSERA